MNCFSVFDHFVKLALKEFEAKFVDDLKSQCAKILAVFWDFGVLRVFRQTYNTKEAL